MDADMYRDTPTRRRKDPNQKSLFDDPPEPPASSFEGPAQLHRDAHDTEIEAKEKVELSVEGLRREVYDAVRQSGERGLAGWEVCELFPHRKPYAVRPRLTELRDAGLLVNDGRRKNPDGNSEMVWKVAP